MSESLQIDVVIFSFVGLDDRDNVFEHKLKF
jgi:hypothetical protein